MQIGIVGYGVIGRALSRFFSRTSTNSVVVYDKYNEDYCSRHRRASINNCDLAFVAVPTPYDVDKRACDLSHVVEAVSNVVVPVCIKSTVPPGTIDTLTRQTRKRIAFSPEYIGESPFHPWSEAYECGFVILSGDPTACSLVRQAYESATPVNLRFVVAGAREAELVKYMHNCFLATKVSFVNQFLDIANDAQIDFDELRTLFLLDERVGASHTTVTRERGFGGRCLPKDLKSLIAWADSMSDTSLLRAVLDYNDMLKTVPLSNLVATSRRIKA